MESIRLVGYAEVNGEKDSVTPNSFNRNDLENRQGVNNNMPDIANSSKGTPSSLNMTIAGGPPPTKQNFKAIISLPIIGQNLRTRLSYDSDFRDHVFVVGGDIQSDSQEGIRIQETNDNTDPTGQLVPVTSEIREIPGYETGSQANIHDSVVDNVMEGIDYAGQPSGSKDKMPAHTETDGLKCSSAGHPSSSKVRFFICQIDGIL